MSITEDDVPSQSVKVIHLPWVSALKDAGSSAVVVDLTGTHVTADKPIHVVSAHQCTYILEDSSLPYESLAKEYLVTTLFVKPISQDPSIKARMVRGIAPTRRP